MTTHIPRQQEHHQLTHSQDQWAIKKLLPRTHFGRKVVKRNQQLIPTLLTLVATSSSDNNQF